MKHLSMAIFCGFSSLACIAQKEKPMMDWVNYSRYATENATMKAAWPSTKRVVFFGDSITEMWKVTDSAFFTANGFYNRGIGGEGTAQMLLRFRQDVINIGATIVVIKAGINDIAENVGALTDEQIAGNIQSMAEMARANKIKVVIASILPANIIPWRKQIYPADRVLHINTLLKEYCKKSNTMYLDYYSALVDDKKGLPEKYSYDGVHVNLTAYKIMESLVLKVLGISMSP